MSWAMVQEGMPANMSMLEVSLRASVFVPCGLLESDEFQRVSDIEVRIEGPVPGCDCDLCETAGGVNASVVVDRLADDAMTVVGSAVVRLLRRVHVDGSVSWHTLEGREVPQALGDRLEWLARQARALIEASGDACGGAW